MFSVSTYVRHGIVTDETETTLQKPYEPCDSICGLSILPLVSLQIINIALTWPTGLTVEPGVVDKRPKNELGASIIGTAR